MVWGAGAVGLLAMASAFLIGAEKVIAIDRFDYRLQRALEKTGAETINYEEVNVLEVLGDMTAGRGPDACIDAVGLEAHSDFGPLQLYDRAKQAVRLETDRGAALREAILAVRNGGTLHHRCLRRTHGQIPDRFPDEPFDHGSGRAMPRPALRQATSRPDRTRRNRSKLCHHSPCAVGAGARRLRGVQEEARRMHQSRLVAITRRGA